MRQEGRNVIPKGVDAAGRQNFKFAVLSSKAWLALDLGLSKLLCCSDYQPQLASECVAGV